MIDVKTKHRLPVAYIMRLLFAFIGFVFILLFTIRGVYQIASTLANCSGDLLGLITGDSAAAKSAHLEAVAASLSRSPGPVFDALLLACTFLIFLHGILGVYYAATTKYSRIIDNKLIFLQIFSALAAGFVLMSLLGPMGGPSAHPAAFWIVCFLFAGFGSFHMGNGLYNACITLGISVSGNVKSALKGFSWFVAVISLIQIIVLLA
jgi:succinate dehydrogenase/fumarate reductase cytochrome b subunit